MAPAATARQGRSRFEGEGAALSLEGGEGGLERRLVILMASRLALALVSLGGALSLDALGGNLTITEWHGFYATVALAFLATGLYGVLLRRRRRGRRFAAIHLATDIAIVSALVHFSGGRDSVFTFLYLLVALYGGILFEHRGALIAGSLGALAYGLVLLAGNFGWLHGGLEAPNEPWPALIVLWAIHAGAVVLVAALGSYLAAELRRTGEALDQRTSDLRHLLHLHERTVESLMSGLLTTDLEGRVTSFNPEAERITGRAALEVVGSDVEAILPGIRAIPTPSAQQGLGPQSRNRMTYRNARGEDLHLGVAAYVLRQADATPGGRVVIFQDVSDVVEMERELRRSERLAAVGQLSASIAHEIRNPLASISGSIQILRRQVDALGAGGQSRQLMDIVLRETDRLNQLITDFLHYARPGPPCLEPVPVARAVEEVLELFEPVRGEAVAVETDIEPTLGACADAAQLRQVLWNLVLNAAQAMPEGGTLQIAGRSVAEPQEAPPGRRNEAQEKRTWTEICISDQGVGIPPGAVDRIFDPFFTTKREGTGLGLAIVHRIVEDHGGSIRLESAVGSGTAIQLRLPWAEAPS